MRVLKNEMSFEKGHLTHFVLEVGRPVDALRHSDKKPFEFLQE
jgi:hypothetical protein